MAAARTFATAIVTAALAVTLSGCATRSVQATSPSQATPSVTPPAPAASSPVAAAPDPTASFTAPPPTVAGNTVVVRLGAAYSPAALRLAAGQQFLVTVSPDVQATQDGVPNPCTPGATVPTGNGLLTGRCAADGVLYTAVHAGTATLSAGVGPRCNPGTMCAQWRARPTLTVTIT